MADLTRSAAVLNEVGRVEPVQSLHWCVDVLSARALMRWARSMPQSNTCNASIWSLQPEGSARSSRRP
jgi:hypothetical protein